MFVGRGGGEEGGGAGVLDMTCPDLPLTIYETSSPSFTLKREALILLIASNHDSPHPYSPFLHEGYAIHNDH